MNKQDFIDAINDIDTDKAARVEKNFQDMLIDAATAQIIDGDIDTWLEFGDFLGLLEPEGD